MKSFLSEVTTCMIAGIINQVTNGAKTWSVFLSPPVLFLLQQLKPSAIPRGDKTEKEWCQHVHPLGQWADRNIGHHELSITWCLQSSYLDVFRGGDGFQCSWLHDTVILMGTLVFKTLPVCFPVRNCCLRFSHECNAHHLHKGKLDQQNKVNDVFCDRVVGEWRCMTYGDMVSQHSALACVSHSGQCVANVPQDTAL